MMKATRKLDFAFLVIFFTLGFVTSDQPTKPLTEFKYHHATRRLEVEEKRSLSLPSVNNSRRYLRSKSEKGKETPPGNAQDQDSDCDNDSESTHEHGEDSDSTPIDEVLRGNETQSEGDWKELGTDFQGGRELGQHEQDADGSASGDDNLNVWIS